MNDFAKFAALSPTFYADAGLGRDRFMDMGIREMWSRIPRIAGPAYTVSCPPGDNLMLHAAIYRAEPGSVIVVQAGDVRYALSGGNVCATAQTITPAFGGTDGNFIDATRLQAVLEQLT